MVYIKKLKIKGQEYWYLFHTVRQGDKFLKRSKYIGKDLPKNIEQLKQEFLDEVKQPKVKDERTKLIESLTPLERKVLPLLKKIKDSATLIEKTGLKDVEVMRALQWLQNKDILKINTELKEIYDIEKKGKEVLEKGFPEKRFLKLLPAAMEKVRKSLTQDEFNVSIGVLKQKQAIKIGKEIEITERGKQILKQESPEEKLLKELPIETKYVKDINIIKGLKDRSLIKTDIKKIRNIDLTKLGEELSDTKLKTNLIELLTPEILSKSSWKNKVFRRYDIKSDVPDIFGGKKHFVNQSIEYAKKIWTELGFKEMTGSMTDTSFWVFDALFTPQDHPAREMQDTFFIKNVKGKLPNNRVVERVKKSHETGVSGSKGWQYKWDGEIAKKVVLRTHTTSLSARTLASLKKENLPAKYFAIGKVFRNETVDWKHGFEFYQTEGIVIDRNANLRNLLGYLKEFYKKMGFEKIKFVPSFFAYTEPSVEIHVFHPEKNIWLELGGAGIFRPEVTEPLLGEPIPVLAWGQGFDRIIMDYYKIKDLREMYSNNLKELRDKKMWIK